jgi:Putative Actinobacterial Holin-X, holin superfamily III
MAQQQMVKDDRSLGDLFTELASETGTLIRGEVALAQAEITEKGVRIGKNVGSLAIAGAVAYLGAMALTAGVIMALGLVIPVWVSALVVGGVIVAVSAVMISSAIAKLKQIDPVPTRTIDSIKEDAKWLKKEII